MPTVRITHKGKQLRHYRYRSKGLATKKYVKSALRPLRQELKYFDTGDVTTQPTNAGAIVSLSSIVQGDTDVDRDGNQVKVRKLLMRIYAVQADATITGPTRIRMMVFIDKQSNNVPPAVTDVLETASPQSPMNLDFRLRFKVLYDKVIVLGGTAASITGGTSSLPAAKFLTVRKMLGNRKLVFPAATNEANTNNIYLLLLSDQATDVPDVIWNSRIRFTV